MSAPETPPDLDDVLALLGEVWTTPHELLAAARLVVASWRDAVTAELESKASAATDYAEWTESSLSAGWHRAKAEAFREAVTVVAPQ
jgi:hypothetical protein